MNFFPSYQWVPIDEILRSNIRLSNAKEDLDDLYKILFPLTYVSQAKFSPGSTLDRSLVKRLESKSHLVDLLTLIGCEDDGSGNFIFRAATDLNENNQRQTAAEEIRTFLQNLAKAKRDGLNEFQRYVQTLQKTPVKSKLSLIVSESIEQAISDGNARTIEVIRQIKEKIGEGDDALNNHSFIRQKLAILLFKQRHPLVKDADDSYIDINIDSNIQILREKRSDPETPLDDEVCVECLMRAEFNIDRAVYLLNNHRPQLPIIFVLEPDEETTSIDKSIESLKQHWQTLQNSLTDTALMPNLVHENDKWKKISHLIPTIIKLRNSSSSQTDDDWMFCEMYRLLNSELTTLIGPQSEVMVETVARILCDFSSENLENLDVPSLRSLFQNSFSDNFTSHAMGSLSMECPICAGFFPRTQMESMLLCSHMCCLECVKNHYRNVIPKIQDTKSLNSLTCFQEAHEITEDVKLEFFLYLDSKFNQWFADSPKILDLYHSNIFYATRTKRIKKCGNPKCISSFETDDNNNIVRVRCPHCNFAQCQQCNKKWNQIHSTLTCDQYSEWLMKEDPDNPDVQVLKYLGTNRIICPKSDCGSIYQYEAGGCEHYTCSKCQTQFCRMCSTLFSKTCGNTFCTMKTIHAHCPANCFRETRDSSPTELMKFLEENKVDFEKDWEKIPTSTNGKCSVEGCERDVYADSKSKFCEFVLENFRLHDWHSLFNRVCFKQFLCSFIWYNQLEPWTLFEDNNLMQMFRKASVPVPEQANRQALIALAKEKLNPHLGKPKKLI